MDDLISRQAAIDALRRLYIENPQIDNDFVYDMALDQADDAIKQLPPIQPKRIKGRWITDKEGYVTWSAICNKCGARTQMFDGYYNFCPHCGAKMEVNHE